MKALYDAYKDKAVIVVIYIREAHPAQASQTAETADWKAINGTVFYQPKTYEERRKLAETACTFWSMNMPVLVDTMEPSIGDLYQSWPNRLYLMDKDGKIVYHGVKGPQGVDVHQGEIELRKLLGMSPGPLVTPERRVGAAAASAPAGGTPAAPAGRGRMPRAQ